MKKSTLAIVKVILNLIISVLLMFAYQTYLFRPIASLNRNQSMMIFYILEITFTVYSCIHISYNRKDLFSVSNTTGLLIYTLMLPLKLRISIIMPALMGLVLLVFIIGYIEISASYIPIYSLTESLITIMLIRVLSLSNELGLSGTTAPKGEISYYISQKSSLTCLSNEEYLNMSKTKRIRLLEALRDDLCDRMGIKHVTLRIRNLREEGNMSNNATYNHSKRTITISKDKFIEADLEKLTELICHEVYHSFQHQLIEDLQDEMNDPLYKDNTYVKKAIQYQSELCDGHYVSAFADFNTYYNQIAEKDARAFATKQVEFYFGQ